MTAAVANLSPGAPLPACRSSVSEQAKTFSATQIQHSSMNGFAIWGGFKILGLNEALNVYGIFAIHAPINRNTEELFPCVPPGQAGGVHDPALVKRHVGGSNGPILLILVIKCQNVSVPQMLMESRFAKSTYLMQKVLKFMHNFSNNTHFL